MNAANNRGLAATFAVPRAQIEAINASIELTLREINTLKPLVEEMRAQATGLTNRAQAVSDAGARTMANVADLLQRALWVLGALLVWLAICAGMWVLDRLALGWHLLRFARYP